MPGRARPCQSGNQICPPCTAPAARISTASRSIALRHLPVRPYRALRPLLDGCCRARPKDFQPPLHVKCTSSKLISPTEKRRREGFVGVAGQLLSRPVFKELHSDWPGVGCSSMNRTMPRTKYQLPVRFGCGICCISRPTVILLAARTPHSTCDPKAVPPAVSPSHKKDVF